MNIVDAIASGQWFGPVETPTGSTAYPFRRCTDGRIVGPDGYITNWTTEQLADDYDVQEPSVRVTKSQLQCAVQDLIHEHSTNGIAFGGHLIVPDPYTFLARRLGLEVPE